MLKKPLLIAVLGPTASGKTGLAIEIAKHLGSEVFSADSRQFYRELDIGVAKPTSLELSMVSHHFVSHKSIHDSFSAGDFEKEALSTLNQYFKNHDHAVLVGGSGLFVKAVLEGLDDFPAPSEDLRNELNRKFESEGLPSLVDQLVDLDPVSAETIDIKNSRRVIRALEVTIQTGEPFSTFKTQEKKERPFDVLKLGIDWSRSELYERINQRCDHMIATGLFDEVSRMNPFRNLNALQTVGYREFFDVIDKKVSLPKAIETFKTRSRNYAKRQVTWLRKDTNIRWIQAPASLDQVKKLIDSVE